MGSQRVGHDLGTTQQQLGMRAGRNGEWLTSYLVVGGNENVLEPDSGDGCTVL